MSVLNAHEPDVKLGRMADFIIWVTKAEEAFGWDNNSFQKAYERNKKGAIQSRLEFDPLYVSIRRYFDDNSLECVLDDTPTELFKLLQHLIDEEHSLGSFPANVAAFSKRLMNLKPDFKQIGINICFIKSGNRRIKIERIRTEEDGPAGEELKSGQEGQQGQQIY